MDGKPIGSDSVVLLTFDGILRQKLTQDSYRCLRGSECSVFPFLPPVLLFLFLFLLPNYCRDSSTKYKAITRLKPQLHTTIMFIL